MDEKRNVCKILVGKLQGKILLGKPRHRQEENKMDFMMGGNDWIDLAQDRNQWRALVNTVMNLRVP
jgi:hypothetical protein